jgi:hypothetical protein
VNAQRESNKIRARQSAHKRGPLLRNTALVSSPEHLEISKDSEAGAEVIVLPAKGFAL